MILSADQAPVIDLISYLKENIPELNEIYEEWPNHNEEFNMPCACVRTVGSPEYNSSMPTFWKRSEDDTKSIYHVGSYDIVLNIDLWAEYKEARGVLVEGLVDLFNKQFQEQGLSLGLSLPLECYHNTIARYDINGYTYTDSEEASQRDEWRAKVTVLVNFMRVMEKEESKMEEVTVDQEVDTDIVIN